MVDTSLFPNNGNAKLRLERAEHYLQLPGQEPHFVANEGSSAE